MREPKPWQPKPLGRPREFDAEDVLAKILDVFWAKGFEGTSLNDLVMATGLKKGSLYAAFGDKRAMYLQALAHYDRTAIEGSLRRLRGPGAPARRIAAFLQAALDAIAVTGDRRGCFLCSASSDQASMDPQTGQAVWRSLDRLATALEDVLGEAAAGDGRPPGADAQHLLAVYVGLRVLARAGQPLRRLEQARDAALRGLGLSAPG